MVAARAVVFIRAEHEAVGLMAFVAVGMCEISSNEVTVREGQRVRAGEQLGMFHYGGSTHCLLFGGGVEVEFAREPGVGGRYEGEMEFNLPVRSAIAVVRGRKMGWMDGGTRSLVALESAVGVCEDY